MSRSTRIGAKGRQSAPGFHVHASNRLEILLENLAAVVSAPLKSPLEPEIIVVQSRGLERWLTRELADRIGVWANGWFPFPNTILEKVLDLAGIAESREKLFRPEVMAWRLMGMLEDRRDNPEFAPLKHYLGEERDSLKRFQLCQRIARVFDRYMVYRPELLLDWESRRPGDWQGQLWRALASGQQREHRTAVWRDFVERVRHGGLPPDRFPSRLSIFGISSLPPFHLEVFSALSRCIEIHLFLVNPSREYWGQLISPKRAAKLRAGRQTAVSAGAEDHFEVGHPLLASMGRLGRSFLESLLDLESYHEHSRYWDPGEGTLLTSIQSDILNLRDPGSRGIQRIVSDQDQSLRIHSCHSPMREMEVLQDQLLHLFDTVPDLSPHEVLVMAPDIETYAPFISAVFGGVANPEKQLPFSIADRSTKSESPVIQAFWQILTLAGGRLEIDGVLDLLGRPVVYRRFDLSPSQLEALIRWIANTRIRWGMDEDHRRKLGLPGFEENSWSAGLRRMLLGYALPESDQRSFQGVFPLDEIEGSEVQALGGLLEYVHRLFEVVKSLESPRTLSQWSVLLTSLVEQFLVSEEETQRDLQFLRTLCQELGELQSIAGFGEPVELPAILHHWTHQFQQAESSRQFLTGGVTFCSMLPMRSIPCRVVALVGMNDGSFPRNERPVGFDLLAQSPRVAGFTRREEDRQLFLETLLSARGHLILTYVGQSIADNHPVAPSVLVSELVDYVLRTFKVNGGTDDLRNQVCIRHRLQAFSESYFTGKGALFSYSEENLQALKAATRRTSTRPALFLESLEEPSQEWRDLDLAELESFFRRPVATFFQQRLGVFFQEELAVPETREPFDLEPLDRYGLKQELLTWWLEGKSLNSLYRPVKARGLLPPGRLGDHWFRELVNQVEHFGQSLKPVLDGERKEPLAVDLTLGPFRLRGTLDGLWSEHLVRYRCADLTAKDRLSLWLDHLVLNCLGAAQAPRQSLLIGSDKRVGYRSVPDCRVQLEKLLSCYWTGLRRPLPLFPKSSYAYAERIFRGKEQKEALKQANSQWASPKFGSVPYQGEESDPYHRLAFREANSLDEQFESIALEVFGPLLSHQVDKIG